MFTSRRLSDILSSLLVGAAVPGRIPARLSLQSGGQTHYGVRAAERELACCLAWEDCFLFIRRRFRSKVWVPSAKGLLHEKTIRGQACLLFQPELKSSPRWCAWVENASKPSVAPRRRKRLDNNEQQPSLSLWSQMFAIVLSVWVESI